MWRASVRCVCVCVFVSGRACMARWKSVLSWLSNWCMAALLLMCSCLPSWDGGETGEGKKNQDKKGKEEGSGKQKEGKEGRTEEAREVDNQNAAENHTVDNADGRNTEGDWLKKVEGGWPTGEEVPKHENPKEDKGTGEHPPT